MKASDLIKKLEEKIKEVGDLDILGINSDDYGANESKHIELFVSTYTSDPNEKNYITLELI